MVDEGIEYARTQDFGCCQEEKNNLPLIIGLCVAAVVVVVIVVVAIVVVRSRSKKTMPKKPTVEKKWTVCFRLNLDILIVFPWLHSVDSRGVCIIAVV